MKTNIDISFYKVTHIYPIKIFIFEYFKNLLIVTFLIRPEIGRHECADTSGRTSTDTDKSATEKAV